jgi:hypothetical protein
MAQQEAAKDYSGLCNRFYIKLDLHQPIFLRCGQDCYIKSFRRVITADTVPSTGRDVSLASVLP